MTDLLRQAVAAAEKLPAEAQDALARAILRDIEDDAKWDTSFADPRSERFFEEMIRLGDDEAAKGALRPAPTTEDDPT